jgi:uncharacterized hydrophobic protein (TIGR00271 family)
MLILRTYVPVDLSTTTTSALAAIPGVRHVVIVGRTVDGLVSISAEVDDPAVDHAVGALAPLGLESRNVWMARTDYIRPVGDVDDAGETDTDERARSELVRRAHGNARTRQAYLLEMVAAGVIAAIGVLTGSSILVVGAMAISPDLLPISAIVVGIVERQWSLAIRSCVVLTLGLTAGALAAAGAAQIVQSRLGSGDDIVLTTAVLGESLTRLGPGSLLVALAAGMASTLALERVGGIVTGVAISVTTIPAAAYIGAASVIEDLTSAGGALVVLGVNIAAIIVAGVVTMSLRHRRRSPARLWGAFAATDASAPGGGS